MLRRLRTKRLEQLDRLLHTLHVPKRIRQPVCDEVLERLYQRSPWVYVGGRWVSVSGDWKPPNGPSSLYRMVGR